MSTSQDSYFWYTNFIGTSPEGQLPTQAIPKSKKTEKWKRACMDFLERVGRNQFFENQKFRDFYRMVDGKLSYTELSEVIPQLRDLEDILNDCEIPSYLKHYDLIGIIVKALAGELLTNGDKYDVQNLDKYGTNDYIREKDELLKRYVSEQFEKELQLRMMEAGLDPKFNDFETEQERQAYIQQIQEFRQEKTPIEIEQYVNSSWKAKSVMWGEATLEVDRERFRMEGMDRQEFIDFLLTGRCFRHHRVGHDYYEPESWSPLNTFFSQDLEAKHAEQSDYIGRVHWFTPSQFVDRYGHQLTAKEKEKILYNKWVDYDGNLNPSEFTLDNLVQNQFHRQQIVPHKNYYDHQLQLGLEDNFGLPLGEFTKINPHGEDTVHSTFLPRHRYNDSLTSRYARLLRDDIYLRSDLIQVTEAYFKSYERIGHLTYINRQGVTVTETVTDDLLPGFLRENNISRVKTITLEEFAKRPIPNTIVYDYFPQYYKGIKASSIGTILDEHIYLGVEPMDFQIKGDSNIFQVKAPVTGIIDTTGLASVLSNFQVPYNVVMNQILNLLEKEIGIFYTFDPAFLPSEYGEWGDAEEALLKMRELAKDIGLVPTDQSIQNTRNRNPNPLTPVNMTVSPQIADRIQLATFYQNKAFEQIGITPQRLGAPTKYETAEGIKSSQDASYAQTEIYFSKFSEYMKRTLEAHLNVAQYAQGSGKDISVFYAKSDGTKAYLAFTDKDFPLRRFNILPVTNSKKRKELEVFKQYIINTNTMGMDELSFAELIQSDSFLEVMEAAKNARSNRERQEQVGQERLIEQLNEEARLEEEAKQRDWERQEISKDRDRQNDIRKEYIEALGRAADNSDDSFSSVLNMLRQESDVALREEEITNNQQNAEANQELQRDRLQFEKDARFRELKLRAEELQERRRKRESDEYQSEINKN